MAGERSYNIVGDQQLAVSSTAVRLTLPTDASGRTLTCRGALIYVGSNAVRWLGGISAQPAAKASSTPTNALGILVAAGAYINWFDSLADYSALIKNAQFIRVTSDAILDIVYFG